MQKVTAILLGAGSRGAHAYAPYALNYPHELDILAVAEPDEERRNAFVAAHNIAEAHAYADWDQLLAQPKMADIAIICTQDQMHYHPTLKALELGYHILLEKPMSPTPEECVEMELAAKKHNRLLTICHVLRYTSFWTAMKHVIDEGKIGQIASIQLNENVGNMHMAHSFVRGNWNNSDTSSPMILAKSCHDMDILSYIMNEPCERVSSFGSLMHFKAENAPEGAPARCLDGCPAEATCQYYAPKYYLGTGRGWASKFTMDTSLEGILSALRTSPYGKCVYRSDNNVVDHQVVNMEFESGATAMFSMCGFTRDNTRIVQVMGTKGDIKGNMEENEFTVHDFITNQKTTIQVDASAEGHSGGDAGIVRSFLREVRSYAGGESSSSASASVRSHLMAFAAEESRLNQGKPVEIEALYQRLVPNPV
ncbi:Gfo/Idh/MocA family oxidoreductase [Paenibacillus sp. SYP-B3998]|uniref:Gfo/Idh/MocA family oxidoreductase n=1 Tax=Paenibacillus sp. SYP-B3998 TaxID=2678564 RepID=A0A6G3ZRZ9_9BACL|nr:Gfo/Idh/MocA family oxidoreductase [Paenibacillus sp. SYP-B3998]NEW04986.1 Gfo/Idh/MocA family oxidoreductase [Paenibacillus sp. SYP-B3998]